MKSKMQLTSPRVGEQAPFFSGGCSDEVTRSSADYRGRWLLLVFLRHFT